MPKTRLEAFSDGVIAIIITIMVLELRTPNGNTPKALLFLTPIFLSYVLSFIYVGIYWNNHHHLLHAAKKINGKTMWANMFLLFALSLIPFATAWMGASHFAPWPVALYGAVLILAAFAYYILVKVLLSFHGKDSELAKALGNGTKEKLSLGLYAVALGVALYYSWLACLLYLLVATLWLIPDRRIENSHR